MTEADITNKALREHYGHIGAECRVRIGLRAARSTPRTC